MVKRTMGFLAAVGVMGAAMATATPASAGSQWQGASVSSTYRYAWGTFQGFRNNADAAAYVDFSTFSGPYFYASLNGTSVSCAVPTSNSAMMTAFNQALTDRDYFYVSWDASGTCTFIAVSNASEYGSY